MRFGLFGTGPWATDTQGPALLAHPRADLVGVWGRDPAKAESLAQTLGVRAYTEVDALIADVEAVAVALPPYVQAPIARQAARAGRHLLLDKPVALDPAEADALAAEAAAAGVASVVFFTSRFQDPVTDFLAGTAGTDWSGGRAVFHGSIFETGSAFGASPWRREHGGLWDVGPHALSLLLPALGPVAAVAAMAAPHDTTEVLLRHRGGAVSTMSLTLAAPPAATYFETVLYGPRGPVTVPGGDAPPVTAFGRAIDALVDGVVPEGAGPDAAGPDGAAVNGAAVNRAGDAGAAGPHPCDVRFGRDVVTILAAADAARASGTLVEVPDPLT